MLVGASGTLLTMLMGRAMNRSIANVLFGAFGQVRGRAPRSAAGADGGTVRSASADDVAVMLAYAHKVVFVPGYGLAVAQAQHDVRAAGRPARGDAASRSRTRSTRSPAGCPAT